VSVRIKHGRRRLDSKTCIQNPQEPNRPVKRDDIGGLVRWRDVKCLSRRCFRLKTTPMGASAEIPRAATNASEIFLTSTAHDEANARAHPGRVMFEIFEECSWAGSSTQAPWRCRARRWMVWRSRCGGKSFESTCGRPLMSNFNVIDLRVLVSGGRCCRSRWLQSSRPALLISLW
jgi:hypothetical protein